MAPVRCTEGKACAKAQRRGEPGCWQVRPHPREDAGVRKGSPQVTGWSGFWPTARSLGCYLGQGVWKQRRNRPRFASRPDLHHGKSELWASRRGGGGWAAGWEGPMVRRTPAGDSADAMGSSGWQQRGAGCAGCGSHAGRPGSLLQERSSSLAGRLDGGGGGRPSASEGEARMPQGVLPQSPVWRPCSGLLSSRPPASLPQAPAWPDAVHRRCREPFIR